MICAHKLDINSEPEQTEATGREPCLLCEQYSSLESTGLLLTEVADGQWLGSPPNQVNCSCDKLPRLKNLIPVLKVYSLISKMHNSVVPSISASVPLKEKLEILPCM